ncbi:DUF72 domain-containing protein [Pseudomonas sp. SDO55104_S430]
MMITGSGQDSVLSRPVIFVGCAGWSLSREHASAFSSEGTHLQRYASRFNAVEINSSFYRPHQRKTYERWAESVPEDFRFCVKIPKVITHEKRLADCSPALDAFLDQCCGLGDRLGSLLVQLPPSLAFDEAIAEPFFDSLRQRFNGPVVLEPRHESWVDAESMLRTYRIAQAAVDPSCISTDSIPGGMPEVKYWRLHGSPRIYFSAYDSPYLQVLADQLLKTKAESIWCIFDNTASGAALGNALALKALLTDARSSS